MKPTGDTSIGRHYS